jgi:hypothetical protein
MPIINIEFRVLAALSMLGSGICSAANNIHIISKGGCGRNSSSIAVNIVFVLFNIYFGIFFFKQRIQVLFFLFGLLVFLFRLLSLLLIIQYQMHLLNIQHLL